MKVPRIIDEGRWRRLAFLITLALLQGAVACVAPLATRVLFTYISSKTHVPNTYLLALAGAGVSIAVLRIIFRRAGERLGQDYARAIRVALFEHASSMWPRHLAERRVGYMSLRFIGDLTALKNWPARGIPRLVEAVILVPALVGVLFMLAPVFGWIGVLVVSVSLCGLIASARVLTYANRHVRGLRAKLAADLAERMPIAADLAALGRRSNEIGLINEQSGKLTIAALALVTRAEGLRVLPDILLGLAAAFVIWRGAAGGLSTGTIAAGLSAFGIMGRPLRDVMSIANIAAAFQTAQRKLVTGLNRPTAPSRSRDGQKIAPGPVSLTLNSLQVEGAGPVSACIMAGDKTKLQIQGDAIAVLRAIAGQEPLLSGDILFTDTRIDDLSPGSLRRRIAIVTDMPTVLHGSLRRAITLGLTDRPSDLKVTERLDACGLLPVLSELGGFERHIREGARTLSRKDRLMLSTLRAAVARPGLILIAPDGEVDNSCIRSWLEKTTATVLRVTNVETTHKALAHVL
jgi:ATP-binding cassette, subfamily B, bacterial